jgi:transposase-like protein
MGTLLQFYGPESRAENVAEENLFAPYSIDELKAAIRETVSRVDSTVRVIGVNRDRLLPLLEELKCRLRRGEWQSFLLDIGVRPCTLRKWRQRARLDGQRMREILFDEPVPRHRPTPAAVEHEQHEALLAQAAVRLAKAVLSRDSRFATRLAQDILESVSL